ncbi:MAG: aspartate kinase [Promethearchaeota archaeon]
MSIVVMKFGGSCLKNHEAFEKIYTITQIYKDYKKVYVASALSGITDLLLSTAQNLNDTAKVDKNLAIIEKKHLDIIEQIFEEDSPYYNNSKDWVDKKLSELEDAFADIIEFGFEPYYQDYVASFGEILSTYILNQFLLSKGLNSVYLAANHIIITNDNFNKAYPLYELTNNRVKNKIIPLLENPKENTIICVTGFIGRNKIGYITTLGRGGSDYTATILARSIHDTCSDKDIKVILWKDVDGFLAVDPKYIQESSLIKNLSYNEAKQISHFGAKILHPKCLEAIEKRNIPLEIRNFDKPFEEVRYTIISKHSDSDQIKGISVVDDATVINIISGTMVDVPGVLAKIFKIMGKNNISVSFVAQSSSEISTSFIVKNADAERAIQALRNANLFSDFYEIYSEKVDVINITGKKILENQTKAKIFNALAKKNIKVKAISQSFEELNLSIIIPKDKLNKAIMTIHGDLCEDFNSNECKNEN